MLKDKCASAKWCKMEEQMNFTLKGQLQQFSFALLQHLTFKRQILFFAFFFSFKKGQTWVADAEISWHSAGSRTRTGSTLCKETDGRNTKLQVLMRRLISFPSEYFWFWASCTFNSDTLSPCQSLNSVTVLEETRWIRTSTVTRVCFHTSIWTSPAGHDVWSYMSHQKEEIL